MLVGYGCWLGMGAVYCNVTGYTIYFVLVCQTEARYSRHSVVERQGLAFPPTLTTTLLAVLIGAILGATGAA